MKTITKIPLGRTLPFYHLVAVLCLMWSCNQQETPTPEPASIGDIPAAIANTTNYNISNSWASDNSKVDANNNAYPNKSYDGSFSTRFSINGIGEHITYDLGSTKNVSTVQLAWYKGNSRTASFRILTGTSTGSLSQAFQGTSSGNTNNLQSYSFSQRSARYVRVVGLGNSANNWLSITEARITGSSGNNGGGSGTAAAIIGGGWKLNGYTGTLNVGSNDNGLNYADNASTAESHFFFEKNGYAAFRTYPGNPTSGGSSNPRTELRETINGGDGYWNGNTNTEHSMKWRFKIEDLPPSGKLAFGQIHERSSSYDDVIRVQVQGSSGQNSGGTTLRILGYVTEEINGSGYSVPNFTLQMDTEYYFELTMRNGVVTLYNLNNSGNRIRTLFQSVDIGNADENYFKAGCYLQSTKSSHASSNVYGQVLIKDLTVSPDN
ncbi:MAG TPA: hypothetical protein DCS93_35050 [Microscillaceae bacterium]|nr:hypothetical protein [Microscillaceae bacterium]